MLRAALISPDRDLTDQVQYVFAALPITIVRVLEYYPGDADLNSTPTARPTRWRWREPSVWPRRGCPLSHWDSNRTPGC
jgi:hypothetical protein